MLFRDSLIVYNHSDIRSILNQMEFWSLPLSRSGRRRALDLWRKLLDADAPPAEHVLESLGCPLRNTSQNRSIDEWLFCDHLLELILGFGSYLTCHPLRLWGLIDSIDYFNRAVNFVADAKQIGLHHIIMDNGLALLLNIFPNNLMRSLFVIEHEGPTVIAEASTSCDARSSATPDLQDSNSSEAQSDNMKNEAPTNNEPAYSLPDIRYRITQANRIGATAYRDAFCTFLNDLSVADVMATIGHCADVRTTLNTHIYSTSLPPLLSTQDWCGTALLDEHEHMAAAVQVASLHQSLNVLTNAVCTVSEDPIKTKEIIANQKLQYMQEHAFNLGVHSIDKLTELVTQT